MVLTEILTILRQLFIHITICSIMPKRISPSIFPMPTLESLAGLFRLIEVRTSLGWGNIIFIQLAHTVVQNCIQRARFHLTELSSSEKKFLYKSWYEPEGC